MANYSFASRLRAAQDVLTVLKTLEDYVSLRQEESVEGLETFINTIITTNTSDISLKNDMKMLVMERKAYFYTGENSVMSLITTLNANIKHQFGKNSWQMELLEELSDRIKSVRIQVTTVTSDNPETESEELETKITRHGRKNYPTLTKLFRDYVTTIASFDGYLSTSELFKLETLTALSDKLTLINDQVEAKDLEIASLKSKRKDMYGELKDRIKRIKWNVKSKYGANSSVYKQIRSKLV